MATSSRTTVELEEELIREKAQNLQLKKQIPQKPRHIIDELKNAVENCAILDAENKELKAKLAKYEAKSATPPAAAVPEKPKAKTRQDWNAEHDAIRNPRERALFRDAHKKELGLAPATM